MNDLTFGATLLSLLAMLAVAVCQEAIQTPLRHATPTATTASWKFAPVRVASASTAIAAGTRTAPAAHASR